MSNSIILQTQALALRRHQGTTQVPATTSWQRFKIVRPDFDVLLPILAAALLLIGFGVVAVPVAVHDLPLLLG